MIVRFNTSKYSINTLTKTMIKRLIFYFKITSTLFSQVNFDSQIQPILQVNCTSCHISGGSATLDLSSYDGIMNGGWSGPAIIPGNQDSSLLYMRIILPEGYPGSMPPNNPLSQNEIDLIGQWINEGAILRSDNEKNHPVSFSFHQNYPNPFNPVTMLHYTLSQNNDVKIIIYDIMGKQVRNLVETYQSAGDHIIKWDATNDWGQSVPAGLYPYKIVMGDFTQMGKMMFLK